jgi:ferrous iron transport protein B
MITIALFGNPNTGKTSLFNRLTGSYEYVGNWSGVTVEKKIGSLLYHSGRLIDLPGAYSLSPLSRDEEVVTRFLLSESFDGMLNIVDASQLERNLHLTVQLMEYGMPMAMGLNMIDVAEQRGIYVQESKLSKVLGVPVVPVIARTGMGCEELSKRIPVPAEVQPVKPLLIDYGPDLEEILSKLTKTFSCFLPEAQHPHLRWIALQWLEGNPVVDSYLISHMPNDDWRPIAELASSHASSPSLPDRIYAARQQFIAGIIERSVINKRMNQATWTDRLDSVLTHRWLGLPIFLFIMYLVFKLTFDWLGSPLSDLLDGLISGPLSTLLQTVLTALGTTSFIQAAILNGVVAGVGGVIVFVPQIFILFLFISWIEDSGYMARIAMVMDRLMEFFGLNGKAFIPMIIGFGCNVPGIMAARSIEQPKERMLTILLTPLMSCSARLAVYSLFAGAFFAKYQALVVLLLYVLGIAVALVLAKLFSSTVLRGEASVFVIELPPYRLPRAELIFRSTWDKGKGFVKKAGTVIFGGSLLIWLLSYTGRGGLEVPIDQSFLASIGRSVAPLVEPLGFGTWQAGAALITGFFAKEVVVSTMNILYFVPDTDALQSIISSAYTPLQAITFMVFVLLYIPCLATVAVIHKESGGVRWTLFAVAYAITVAYVIAFAVYKIGHLLGYA